VQPGAVLLGRFEVERRVGANRIASVFQARDLELGQRVAVKVLHPTEESDHRERLWREAVILRRLIHPRIARYVTHGELEDGAPFLATEWIEGETLGSRLVQQRLTLDECICLGSRVAETLEIAHQRGIVHRDIKPENLILRNGSVEDPVLIDFGVAHAGPGSLTQAGVILGTLGFMPPEQARGEAQLDARADVFALGAVLFKCITGQPVFGELDEIALLSKTLTATPPTLRSLRDDVPPALDELVGAMLARDPSERPAEAGVVRDALGSFGLVGGRAEIRAASTAPAPVSHYSVVPTRMDNLDERQALLFAEQLERRGEFEQAIAFYRRAAAQALASNDFEACLMRADRGIICGAEGEILGRLLLRKAEAHKWRGENLHLRACAEAALALFPRSEARWFSAAAEVMEASARLGEQSALHHAVDALCEVSARGKLAPFHVGALARAACVLLSEGNLASAEDFLRVIEASHAVGDADAVPEPATAAHVTRAKANRALMLGDTSESLALCNSSIRMFEAIGDTRNACRYLVTSAAACLELGAFLEAERALSNAGAAAGRMGLVNVRAHVIHEQALLFARLGDLQTGIVKSSNAIEAFMAQGDQRMETSARLRHAFILLRAGNLDEATSEVEATFAQGTFTLPQRVVGFALRAATELGRGLPSRAVNTAMRAMEILDSIGGIDQGESFTLLVNAEALMAAGDRAAAQRAIERATHRVHERRAMIQDASWAKAFMERIDEHVRIEELSRSL
jgi:tetratricopeptide (TPR) repeat protein